MPIDGHLQAVLELSAEIDAQSRSWGLPEAERRRQVSERIGAALPRPAYPDVERTDLYVTAAGREVPVRLYRPQQAAESVTLPLMIYAHGGGWVAGSIATHDVLCAEVAVTTGYAVASVHYRRAPENPHPAQHEDLWDAADWLRRHGALLGLDVRRPMALGGDSAGAHLVLGCAWRARTEAPGRYDRLLLFYPGLDPELATPSAAQFALGPGLIQAAVRYFWQALLKDAPQDERRAWALPMTWPQEGLATLPATVLVTAEFDLLRDEGAEFAARLHKTGVPVEHWCARDMVHGFGRMLGASPVARGQVRDACRALMKVADAGMV